ncbi:MAG TPA: hypothetical protein VFR68_04440, partial [Candidatus Dormibacteraeota bacterium]|nr:hypothetical protein [Candidatus Dormibacteraeota bacterium]
FARLSGQIDVARSELARAAMELTDYAFESHQLDLEATATGDWQPVLGDAPGEKAALDLFWPKQALLFEPNHAFSFGFLDYQERLKPDYRARRR